MWKERDLKLYNHFESQSFPCSNSRDPRRSGMPYEKKKRRKWHNALHIEMTRLVRKSHTPESCILVVVSMGAAKGTTRCARASLSGMPDLPSRLLHALTEIHTVYNALTRGNKSASFGVRQ